MRLEHGQFFHPFDSLIHVPDLVGIHHQSPPRTDLFANNPRATDLVLKIPSDLHFEMGPALAYSFAHQPAHLSVRVTHPSRGVRLARLTNPPHSVRSLTPG